MSDLDELDKRREVLARVAAEATRARTLYPRPYASSHEAYAVLLEELDEVWDEVRKKADHRDRRALCDELVQVAALAVLFATDHGALGPACSMCDGTGWTGAASSGARCELCGGAS